VLLSYCSLYCEPARLCRMRHEKSPQILNDIGQRVRPEGHILDERVPLLNFVGILGECVRQRVGRLGWNLCFASREGRRDSAREAVAFELVGAREQPNVVEVIHAAIGSPQLYHCLKFLGDDGLTYVCL
jgi:hypothetical protein